MTTFFSVSTLLLLCAVSLVQSHVVLVHPTPRTDNDYLRTDDDGVCDPESTCTAFCGDTYNSTANPLTILEVGVPLTLRWMVTAAHLPEKYRLSLNPTATDDHFDLSNNILTTVTNGDAADSSNVGSNGSFSTTVTIPESALDTCSQADSNKPCVLQLWDLYYFVSCGNVLLTTKATTSTPTTTPTTSKPTTTSPPTVTCINNSDFRIKNKEKKTCAWLMLTKKTRQTKFCKIELVRTSCPISCGLCCADSDTFKFMTKKEKMKRCIWLGKGKGKKNKRVQHYCKKKKVKTGCAESCDNCPNNVSTTPSNN